MSSYILCIETSGPQCSVALSSEGQTIIDHVTEDAWHHSQFLTTYINQVLQEADIDLKQLDAVAVSHGPGSYTGLRVGASTAKGICYALDIPLISIDTLKIIAYPWIDKASSKVLATIDARRDEVYYNVYDQNLEAQEDTQAHVVISDSFKLYQDEGLIITGDGATKIKELLTHRPINYSYKPSYPSAKYMALIAYNKFFQKEHEDIAYYSPFYMKPPNITTRKKPLF